MIGRKLSSGPPVSRPTSPLNHPHWNTAVLTPKVAAMLRRNPAVAFSGMITERKISKSSSSESPTIIRRYSGSALLMRSVISRLIAVSPVTPIVTFSSVATAAPGSRSAVTSSAVRASSGPCSGMTVNTARVRSGLAPMRLTDVTLSVSLRLVITAPIPA